MTKLSKPRLHEILSQRFETGFKKLSDIPNPSLLHDGIKSAKRIALAMQNDERIYIVGDYDVLQNILNSIINGVKYKFTLL